MKKILQITMFWLVLVLVTIGYRLASKENQADIFGINSAQAGCPPDPPPPQPQPSCDSCGSAGCSAEGCE